jgi:DNA-binding CsgD family transcriptional regulator
MKRRTQSKPPRRTAKRRAVARRRRPEPALPAAPAAIASAPVGIAAATPEDVPKFPPGWDRLTPMQQRVLQLVAAGRTTNAIAAELGASPHTVQAHRMHIAVRLGLRGRTALQRFVQEHRQPR